MLDGHCAGTMFQTGDVMAGPLNDCLPRPNAAPAALWPWVLAIATIVGLLLALHQVLREAVFQGELQRKANAAYAEATWRCNASRGASLRDRCLAKLIALPERDATPQDQPVVTARAGTSQWAPRAVFTQVLDHD